MSLETYAADWPAPAGVRTRQTTRRGGLSTGAYAGLNLALHVGDDPSLVRANRALLVSELELPDEPRWLEQVHGTRVLDIDRGDGGDADGAVTAQPGVVLAVMTADCLPVLLAAADGSRIGVAHAGWRGLAAGIVARAVAALECDPSGILAWLGPAIGPGAFEVGDEVRAAFVEQDAGAAADFERNARGRWQADLRGLAQRKLADAGVSSIYGGPGCSYSEPERYFSHRREAPCGRMATLIWREA